MVQELNLDKASFDRFWGYMVVDSGGGGGTNGAEGRPGSSSGGRRLKQRKNRRSISMNHVKDLIDARIKEKAAGVEAHIKDNDDELELRYGKEMAQFIYEVVGSSDATGDDVLACMMGLIPGLGEAAPLIRKQCFGCLEDLISEEALHAALEYSMRTTRERPGRKPSRDRCGAAVATEQLAAGTGAPPLPRPFPPRPPLVPQRIRHCWLF